LSASLDVFPPTDDTVVKFRWEEPFDIRTVYKPGIVALPSKNSIELMCRYLKFRDWIEIPIHTRDMPADYIENRRASWLIRI